jgi:hypothetical protein
VVLDLIKHDSCSFIKQYLINSNQYNFSKMKYNNENKRKDKRLTAMQLTSPGSRVTVASLSIPNMFNVPLITRPGLTKGPPSRRMSCIVRDTDICIKSITNKSYDFFLLYFHVSFFFFVFSFSIPLVLVVLLLLLFSLQLSL